MGVTIIWIEGKRAESPSFIPNIRKKGYSVEIFTTGTAALDRLAEEDPDSAEKLIAVVNAASLRTSGIRICQSLRKQMELIPIILIVSPDSKISDDTSANLVLKLPFTYRKLINRIVRLTPGDGNKVMKAGSIKLDMERKLVYCEGREARLTPRLARILQTLMRHPGEVLYREQLFREIWNTEYTGDTRTLDVHISWLRHAIEEDPKHPLYLKTIRGVGYRLDV